MNIYSSTNKLQNDVLNVDLCLILTNIMTDMSYVDRLPMMNIPVLLLSAFLVCGAQARPQVGKGITGTEPAIDCFKF